MTDISMVLMTCDEYEDTWWPFVTQLRSNWPEFNMPIYLGAESKIFSYPGFDIRCPLSKGRVYSQWSKRLLELLDKIESEYVLFSLDDFWLTDKVDNTEFQHVFTYIKSNRNIGFICLLHEDKLFLNQEQRKLIIESEFEDLNEWKKGLPFRITTQAGIWRKKYLIKLLRSHESAWFFETRATWRSKFCKERVLNVKHSILNYPVGGVIGGGMLYRDYLPLYNKNITSKCLSRGLIDFGAPKNYPAIKKGFMYYYSIFKSVLPKWCSM